MYQDMDAKTLDNEVREEWEDDIQSFVPAFAHVKPTYIKQRDAFDAHLALDGNGEAIIRLIDEDETMTMSFPLKSLFNVDVEQFQLETWEMYIGMLEVYHQLRDVVSAFEKKIDEAGEIMYGRGFNVEDAHLRVVSNNEAKQDQ